MKNVIKAPRTLYPFVHLSIHTSIAQTSELLWQSCILTTNMGSVLTDPFTTSCTPSLHPSFPSFCLDRSTSTRVTMMRTVNSNPTSAPTTVTRPSSSSSAFSSLGSTPSTRSSFDPPARRLARSKAICMILVPRLLSAPISSATSGTSSPADLLER